MHKCGLVRCAVLRLECNTHGCAVAASSDGRISPMGPLPAGSRANADARAEEGSPRGVGASGAGPKPANALPANELAGWWRCAAGSAAPPENHAGPSGGGAEPERWRWPAGSRGPELSHAGSKGSGGVESEGCCPAGSTGPAVNQARGSLEGGGEVEGWRGRGMGSCGGVTAAAAPGVGWAGVEGPAWSGGGCRPGRAPLPPAALPSDGGLPTAAGRDGKQWMNEFKRACTSVQEACSFDAGARPGSPGAAVRCQHSYRLADPGAAGRPRTRVPDPKGAKEEGWKADRWWPSSEALRRAPADGAPAALLACTSRPPSGGCAPPTACCSSCSLVADCCACTPCRGVRGGETVKADEPGRAARVLAAVPAGAGGMLARLACARRPAAPCSPAHPHAPGRACQAAATAASMSAWFASPCAAR